MNRLLAFLIIASALVMPSSPPEVIYSFDAISNDPFYTGTSLWNMHGDSLSSNKNPYGSQADEAWYQNYTGSSSIVVGILDGGIQTNHPDLAQNIWVNPKEIAGNGIDDDKNGYIDDINGWNFDLNSGVWPSETHGTHVAGIVGAKGGNGIGVAGVNWNVKVAVAKVSSTGGIYDTLAIKAIDYFIALKKSGVNVVALNASWGSSAFSKSLSDAVNRAGDAGIIFVASAGNSSTNNDIYPNYPASFDCSKRLDNGAARGYDCILSVGAIDSTGAQRFNYGATTVDIAAPGVSINSTVPTSGYASYSGTSMAAPHVAGAVVLCYSINPALTPGQVISAILGSSTSTSSMLGKNLTNGRLNIGDMVNRCKVSTDTTTPSDMTGSPSNLTATAATDRTINLAWTDGASGETMYQVEIGATCDSLVTLTNLTSNVTSYSVTGLTPLTSYCFRVKAMNATTTAASNTASTTTLATPIAPTAFSKKSPGIGTRPYGPGVVLQWYVSSNMINYEYCISTTKAGCINWKSVGTNLFVSLTLSLNVQYYWQVRAVGSGGITYADAGTLWYFAPK